MKSENHVCPVWMGYFLLSPIRKIYQNPYRILKPFVTPGMQVLDVGCGMGYFSIPLAEMTGEKGKVICVDLQEGMLKKLRRRAEKRNLLERIVIRNCGADSLQLEDYKESFDFVLAFAIVHEVPDAAGFFREIYAALKSSGSVLFSEPGGRVTRGNFEASLKQALDAGFSMGSEVFIRKNRSVILTK